MGFDEDQHPRGDDGKFIETGGQKLKAWSGNRPKSGGPSLRDKPDERIPRVGDFMRMALAEAKGNPDGWTVRPGYKMPTSGTVVSLPTSAGFSFQVKPGEKASRQSLREWVKKARNYLRNNQNAYIGGWRGDDGKFYFDVNEIHPHEKAMELGRQRNQRGVFNLDEAAKPRPASLSPDAPWGYHPTGGTGE